MRPAGIEIVLQLVAKRLSTPGIPLTLDDIPRMSQPEAMQVVKSTDQLYQIAKVINLLLKWTAMTNQDFSVSSFPDSPWLSQEDEEHA